MIKDQAIHEKTFQLVKEALKEITQKYRELFRNKLKQKKGYWSRFRYFLFLYPNFCFFSQLIIVFLFIGFAILFNIKQSNDWGRLGFILAFLINLWMLPSLLVKFTPKLKIGWEELWSKVLESYLVKLNLEILQEQENSVSLGFWNSKIKFLKNFKRNKNSKLNDNLKRAKQNLKRAILYYKRLAKCWETSPK